MDSETESPIIKHELKKIPPYPWKLKLNSKTKLTEMLDANNQLILAFKRSDVSLILANFIRFAPERFEELLKD